MIPEHTIVVLEPEKSRKRLVAMVEQLGYSALGLDDPETAVQLVRNQQPSVVLASHPSHTLAVLNLREAGLGGTALAITFAAKEPDTAITAERLGADAFTFRPYRRDGLGAALYASLKARELRTGSPGDDRAAFDAATGFYRFEFFKQILLLELLRAKRYKHGVAICVLAIDPGSVPASNLLHAVSTAATQAIRSAIRDIDIPVTYADAQYLIFLPHTEAEGAERVGRRIVQQVRRSVFRGPGIEVAPTVSVGIAAVPAGGGPAARRPISFAKLIHNAQTALKAAQLKGGDQVIVRT
jgi:diguanylate cyclase (GGDEF)-like protein